MDKISNKKGNYRPVLLKNKHAKILDNIFTNQIQQYIKRIILWDMGLISGMQGWFNIHKSINLIHHINKRKDKNHIIISIDAEKQFDKIQHPFMIKKNSHQSCNWGNIAIIINIIKAIYDKPQLILHPMVKSWALFLPRQGCPFLNKILFNKVL